MNARGILAGVVLATALAGGCRDNAATSEATNAQRSDPPPVASSAPATSSSAAPAPAPALLREDLRTLAVQIRTTVPPSKAEQAALEGQTKAALPGVVFGATSGSRSRLFFEPAGTMPEIPAAYRGELDAAAMKVIDARSGFLLSAKLEGMPELKHVRAFEALALEMAEKRKGLVWDESTYQMFSTQDWKAARVDSWAGDLCDVAEHTRLRYYAASRDRYRSVTYGMDIFGLPDLVIQDVPPPHSDRAMALLDAAAQALVEGAELTASGQLDIDLAAIKHPNVKRRLTEAATRPGRVSIKLTVATPEEGDPENRLLALDVGAFPGASDGERLGSVHTALFGPVSDEPIFRPGDDAALAEVAERVQAKVPDLAARTKKGIPPGEVFLVKAPFDTDDGNIEWMWIDVTGWDGATIRGHLANTPYGIKGLAAGAKVEVNQSKIVDYTWSKPGGTREGGESIKLLEERRKKQGAR